MPTYSYRCEKCRKKFDLQMTIAVHDKGSTKCPKCGSRSIRQQIASIGVITSKKS